MTPNELAQSLNDRTKKQAKLLANSDEFSKAFAKVKESDPGLPVKLSKILLLHFYEAACRKDFSIICRQ